jgi:hypothetical protein
VHYENPFQESVNPLVSFDFGGGCSVLSRLLIRIPRQEAMDRGLELAVENYHAIGYLSSADLLVLDDSVDARMRKIRRGIR